MTRHVSQSVLMCAAVTTIVVAAAATPLHAETYRFAPAAFPQTFSAAHPVALRIKSGDSVRTVTREDEPVAGSEAPGSTGPLTGPFYVEGAEPGDLLVVMLTLLEPNQPTGRSASLMAPGAVPGGSLSRPRRGDTGVVTWTIDKTKGVVRLDLTTTMPNVNWRSRFRDPMLELPLRPSLVPFTPWSTLDDYLDLLEVFEARGLLPALDPVQLSIRLLVPPGSLLEGDPEIAFEGLEPSALTWRWRHPDPRMDALQRRVAAEVEAAAARGEEPLATIARVKVLALAQAGLPHGHVRTLAPDQRRVPRLTESWFC
jgi:hypothetical protein